jgi:acetoin utilization deacetylase AcuC-like enzyme
MVYIEKRLGFFHLSNDHLRRREKMNKTGIVKDERYMQHQMGAHHPESPERLKTIYAMLEEPDMRGRFVEVPVRRAERDELLLVHSPDYVGLLAATEGKPYTYLDPDTQTCAASYEAALLAAGGFCQAVSMVETRKIYNAFALVRPPGHHAEKSRAMGFCLFNNVAIGARYARESLKLHRLLIVDWDLHHGNGTQHSFEEDPSILYFSIHQYPYYPGTGAFDEIGRGVGEGFTVNIPIPVGCGDREYLGIFEKILKPVALEFNPQMILVSAGFDTYEGDPLGGMQVTPAGFAGMTRSIMEIAEACCDGKVVITLEGGYHVQGQSISVKEVLKELSGLSNTDVSKLMDKGDDRILDSVVKQAKEVHHRYWKTL